MVSLPRETLETVFANQEEIRRTLEKLVQERRAPTEAERGQLLSVWWRGTLGFGGVYRLGGSYPGISKKTLDGIVRIIVSGKPVVECAWDGSAEEIEVEIWQLAEMLLAKCLDGVFSAAVRRALELTPEREGGDVFGGIRQR